MNIESKTCLGGLCLAGLLAAPSVQADISLAFDDNGNSTGLTAYVATRAIDARSVTSGTITSIDALDYVMQLPLTGSSAYPQQGWVAIYAASDTSDTGLPIKLMHFDNSWDTVNGSLPAGVTTDNQQLFFYSDVNNGSLAYDYGNSLWSSANSTIMNNILALPSTQLAKVNEGDGALPNVTYYTPTSSQPGYGVDAGNGTAYTYQFIDTPVPEPATMISGALMLLPFGASTLRFLRKNPAA
jgi:hypothetical protein